MHRMYIWRCVCVYRREVLFRRSGCLKAHKNELIKGFMPSLAVEQF